MQATWSELVTRERIPRLALVCLGIWLNAADSLVVTTIMPSVARDIGGYALFAWPIASYLVGAILGGAGAGRLSERHGLHAALPLSAAFYAMGCAVSALAPGMVLFLAGRFLQGIGAGLIVGLCYVSANLLFPAALWRRVLAMLSGVWGVATLLGPLLGGMFGYGGDWRILFWLFAGQAFLFGIAAWLLVPHRATGADGDRIPLRTLALLGLAVLFLLLAGSAGHPWRSVGFLAGGGGFLIAALRHDASAPVHLLPRDFGNVRSAVGQGYATIFLLSAATVGFSVYGAAVLQALYGLSPLAAGYAVGAEAASWTLIALLVAELPEEAKSRCIRIGAIVITAGVISSIVSFPSGSLAAVLVSALCLGGGFGAASAFLTRHIVELLPPAHRGIGASAVPTTQMLGNSVGSAIAEVVANGFGASHGIDRVNAGRMATWLFVVATPLAIAGLLSAWRTTRSAPSLNDVPNTTKDLNTEARRARS